MSEKGRILTIIIFLAVFLASWIVPIIIGANIARKKNYSPHWMWFGLYPGVGLVLCIVFACLSPRRVCPKCGKKINSAGSFCQFCGNQFLPEETKIDDEKHSVRKMSDRKKIIIIVCSVFVVLFAFVLFVFSIVDSAFSNSMPFKQAIEAVKKDDECVAVLGDNVVRSGSFSGSVSRDNNSGSADFSFGVKGDKGSGRVYLVSSCELGTWHFSKLYFCKNEKDAKPISLLKAEQEMKVQ